MKNILKKYISLLFSVCYVVIFFAFFLHFAKKSLQKALLLTLFLIPYGNLFAHKIINNNVNDSSINYKTLKYGSYKQNEYINAENKISAKTHLSSNVTKEEIYKARCAIEDYIRKGKKERAQYIIDRVLSIKDLNNTNRALTNYLQAKLYYSDKKYLKSIELLKTNKLLYKKKELNNLKNNGYYYLGLNYYKLKNYNEALIYFKQSLPYIKIDDTFYFDTHLKIALCYYRLNKNDEAFHILNSGIVFLNNYSKAEMGYLLHARILQLRSFLLREEAISSNDSVSLLQQSVADCELSVSYINRYVKQQYFESDQLVFNDRYNYFFYKTIEAINRLHQAVPNDSLLFKAFNYAELDKNLALLRNIQKQNAQKQLQLPPQKVKILDSLTYLLVKTEEEVYNLQYDPTTPDSTILNLLNIKGQLISRINQKEHELEEAYPEYYSLKYKLPALDINFLKKLSYQKQIIEYVISDENIYMFFVNNGTIHQQTIKYTPQLSGEIENFRQLTADINHINFSDAEFKDFQINGNNLYKHLIEPISAYLNDKPLLIIPDNELNLIPFEAFVTVPYSDKNKDYSELSYLINQYDISYAYSIGLLKYQSHSQTNQKPRGKVLSYAPTYQNLSGNEGNQYLAMRNARDELGKLPGALSEINYIKKLVQAKNRIDSRASESNFKNEARLYPVLHCAMHALVDNDNPLFSKLVFTPDADADDDGLLNTYEIGHLKLNANLVVLSACNTAYGNINKGEGLQSISRGFIKAGCKSILSTLWSVSDETSGSLIKWFYDGLANGQSKSASLSQAKRTFITNNSGIDAHPFYWAGYVFSGNDEPIPLQNAGNKFLYLLFLLLIPIAVIVRRKS